MALKVGSRIWETDTATGTNNFTLDGAVGGYRRFSAIAANNDTVPYYAVNRDDPTEWEYGIGTWTTGNNLARTTIIESSNADAKVVFSAGTKDIFVAPSPRSAVLDLEDQAFTGGVIVTSKDLGSIGSGTVTPDPGARPQQHYTNHGAHTLAPSANVGSVLVDITNDSSAGAITTSGFTKVAGDAFDTTNGHKFRCHISIGAAGSLLTVQALQ